MKLLQQEPPYGSGDWQLYNLADDPGEQNDLALQHPELTKELIGAWQIYADKVGVIEPDKPIHY